MFEKIYKLHTKSQWNDDDIDEYKTVESIQNKLQEENSDYLNKHTEIRAIIRTILDEAINKDYATPIDLVRTVFNCNTNAYLKIKIDGHRQYVEQELQKRNWNKHDLDNVIKCESTHSLLSSTSMSSDLDGILMFCCIMPKPN